METKKTRIRTPKPTPVLTVLGPISVDVLNSLVKVLPGGTMISQTTTVEINGKPRAVFDFIAPVVDLSGPSGGPGHLPPVPPYAYSTSSGNSGGRSPQ
jgi:hypothetical protein